jgi:hypothetical protein
MYLSKPLGALQFLSISFFDGPLILNSKFQEEESMPEFRKHAPQTLSHTVRKPSSSTFEIRKINQDNPSPATSGSKTTGKAQNNTHQEKLQKLEKQTNFRKPFETMGGNHAQQ